MTDVDPEVIARLDSVAKERLEIQVELDALEAGFKDAEKRLKDSYAAETAPLEQRAAELDNQIWHELDTHRSALVKSGKQSFITLVARFQLRHSQVPAKVLDEDAVLEIARKLRLLRKVADPPRKWRLNHTRFMKWLDQHGDYRHLFENYIEDAKTKESLTAQPNSTFTVPYNGERISPPSVSIKRS